jgi:hypothetical protein
MVTISDPPQSVWAQSHFTLQNGTGQRSIDFIQESDL